MIDNIQIEATTACSAGLAGIDALVAVRIADGTGRIDTEIPIEAIYVASMIEGV
jgi:hypothetical protein